MIRFILVLLISYVVYVVYRKTQNTQIPSKSKDPGKESTCPSPKDFIDYTEGRIKGKKKEAISSHIAHCKNCQDALKGVFDMPGD